MTEKELSIRKVGPDVLAEEIQRLVIGFIPFSFAVGQPRFKATVRFQCGDLFFPILDALIYEGNEITVGGRRIELEKGQELWVVSLRTKEDPTCIERHANAPSVSEETPPNGQAG